MASKSRGIGQSSVIYTNLFSSLKHGSTMTKWVRKWAIMLGHSKMFFFCCKTLLQHLTVLPLLGYLLIPFMHPITLSLFDRSNLLQFLDFRALPRVPFSKMIRLNFYFLALCQGDSDLNPICWLSYQVLVVFWHSSPFQRYQSSFCGSKHTF